MLSGSLVSTSCISSGFEWKRWLPDMEGMTYSSPNIKVNKS
jgi:hypothetical protein